MQAAIGQRLPPWPSLAPFQPIFEAANIVGLFEWDLVTGHVIPCLGMTRLFGLDRSAVLSGAPAAAFLPTLHPEDRAPFAARCDPEGSDVTRLSYRLNPVSSAPRTIVESAHYVRDETGRPIWFCGALFDGLPNGLASARNSERLEYAALLAIELYRTVSGIDMPGLKSLASLILFEIGSGLASKDKRPP